MTKHIETIPLSRDLLADQDGWVYTSIREVLAGTWDTRLSLGEARHIAANNREELAWRVPRRRSRRPVWPVSTRLTGELLTWWVEMMTYPHHAWQVPPEREELA